jgi:CDP-diacylglycerol--glycerol-3-phosphate 3-phosphatidyltransferase
LRSVITANHVTLARLVPMPLLAWWIYAGHYWTALVVGTIVGCTDFVDGWMARRSGPTVLGGLLDPMADKIFVALIYAPFADLGLIPWWACGLMFIREFLVTALRSAYERRSLSMKTSYLGKVKTWTQMQGIGVMLLFPLIGARPLMTWLLIGGLVAPLLAMVALYLVKKKFWKGTLVMSASFALILAVHLRHDEKLTMEFIMLMVVALTWVSGLDYILGSWKHLRGRGDFGAADAVRVFGAILLPSMVFVAISRNDTAAWPLLIILATELGVGGLDNLLSHHQKASGALPWGARVFGVVSLLALTLVLPSFGTILAVLAAALSTAGVAWEFWRGRDYYMDARLRDKAPRGVALQQSSG